MFSFICKQDAFALERTWVTFLFQREDRGMGIFVWSNTAVNRLEKFLQKLPGVKQSTIYRGCDCETNYQSESHESWSGVWRTFSPIVGKTQVRYPKQILMKGMCYCIPPYAARDYSLSLAVPDSSMPGIRLSIVKVWEPGSALKSNTSLHREIREQESVIKTETNPD